MNNKKIFGIVTLLTILLGIFELLWVKQQVPLPHPTCDDSFITFRYVRNIVEGNGIVFNIGERVLGTSTLLWTFILAFLAKCFNAVEIIPELALSLTVFIYLIFFFLTLTFALKSNAKEIQFPALQLPLLILILLIAFLSPQAQIALFSGMETCLVLLLIAVAYICYKKKKYPLLGIVSGLIFWTRIEVGVIFIGSFVVTQLFNAIRKSSNLRMVKNSILNYSIPFLIAVLAYLIFNWRYFGDWLPNTLRAKLILYSNMEWTIPRLDIIKKIFFIREKGIFIFIIAGIIFFKTIVNKARMNPLYIFGLLYSLFLLFFVPRPQPWYYHPIFFCLVIGISVDMGKTFPLSRPDLSGLLPILIGMLITFQNLRELSALTPASFSQGLFEISKALKNKEAKIFCADIGRIGFYAKKSYIYDFAGLVTPEAIPFNLDRETYNNRINISSKNLLAQIFKEQPDFIVLADYMSFLKKVTSDSLFNTHYYLLQTSSKQNLYARKNRKIDS